MLGYEAIAQESLCDGLKDKYEQQTRIFKKCSDELWTLTYNKAEHEHLHTALKCARESVKNMKELEQELDLNLCNYFKKHVPSFFH